MKPKYSKGEPVSFFLQKGELGKYCGRDKFKDKAMKCSIAMQGMLQTRTRFQFVVHVPCTSEET